MKRSLILAALCASLALGGCSSMWAGTVVGGAGGLVGPGANAFKLVQTEPGCPDLAGAGSTPLAGVKVSCTVNADGSKDMRASVDSADPTQIMLQALQAQAAQAKAAADLLQQLVPLALKAAETAGGIPPLFPTDPVPPTPAAAARRPPQ